MILARWPRGVSPIHLVRKDVFPFAAFAMAAPVAGMGFALDSNTPTFWRVVAVPLSVVAGLVLWRIACWLLSAYGPDAAG